MTPTLDAIVEQVHRPDCMSFIDRGTWMTRLCTSIRLRQCLEVRRFMAWEETTQHDGALSPTIQIVSMKFGCRIWLGLRGGSRSPPRGRRIDRVVCRRSLADDTYVRTQRGRGIRTCSAQYWQSCWEVETAKESRYFLEIRERGDLILLVNAKLPDITFRFERMLREFLKTNMSSNVRALPK